MLPSELDTLGPEFREGERFLGGGIIDWAPISYETMKAMVVLRRVLDEPIILIRGAHPNQPTAVDACCPNRSLGEIAMALTRLDGVCFGVYTGNSFHVDTRPRAPGLRTCWMAIHPNEEDMLKTEGLESLVMERKDGWVYLSWNHPASYRGLEFVCDLARVKEAA